MSEETWYEKMFNQDYRFRQIVKGREAAGKDIWPCEDWDYTEWEEALEEYRELCENSS